MTLRLILSIVAEILSTSGFWIFLAVMVVCFAGDPGLLEIIRDNQQLQCWDAVTGVIGRC